MIYLLIFLWFAKVAKSILFWVYLWQLKEYHHGRFRAHFRTAKGKNLLFNKRILLKIASALVLGFCWYLFIPYFSSSPFSISSLENFSKFLVGFVLLVVLANLFLYSSEFLKIGKDLVLKELRIPVLTKKRFSDRLNNDDIKDPVQIIC